MSCFVALVWWIAGVGVFWTCSPSPLIPLPSRERGKVVGVVLCRPALWIPAYAGMTVGFPSRKRARVRLKTMLGHRPNPLTVILDLIQNLGARNAE